MIAIAQRAELRVHMENELADIARQLETARQGTATVVLDQTSVGRLSRLDAMQQQAMSASVVQRLMLRQRRLQAALARVGSESYGLCCECGEEIAHDRLWVDPAGPFCPDCQSEIDARRKSA